MKNKTIKGSNIAQAWLLISAVILLSLASFMLMSGIQFFPSMNLTSGVAQFYYWITYTGTFPFAIITALVIVLFSFTQVPRHLFKRLVPALVLSLLLSLGIGYVIKILAKEPRPNIVLMAEANLLDIDTFTHLDKAARKQEITQAIPKLEAINPNIQLSTQIKQHWQQTTDNAFPSGHVAFAVTLTLVINYYLIMAGLVSFPIILITWSFLMDLSRLFLGMHWPQDILAATLLSISCSAISLYIIEKYLTAKRLSKPSSSN
ncbi:phosphatase PAP2 family protein [Shewanella surugensis]|uniref:undecaprenyl-diphosphate phosphatase n=1 Tax=Shewanella surugensis TaxID=212020 RepID=A0ABT0LH65_9GAMM|nr:phosphatase PAP2 family protein [Shewanella surugensis]MCL1126909.1 phosphatase PAP2 family protein [Shewanella surugensis]